MQWGKGNTDRRNYERINSKIAPPLSVASRYAFFNRHLAALSLLSLKKIEEFTNGMTIAYYRPSKNGDQLPLKKRGLSKSQLFKKLKPNKMKKALLVSMTIFSIMPLLSFAQDAAPKVREVGLNFSNLNNFGIRYKCGTDKTLLRLTLLSINGSSDDTGTGSGVNNQSHLGFGFNIGFEKRKVVNEKFDFYYGLDLLTSYNYSTSDQNNTSRETWGASPGLGLVLGLRYKISNDFNISAEVVPSVKYSTGETITTNSGVKVSSTTSGYSFGLANNSASLTLAYRFGK